MEICIVTGDYKYYIYDCIISDVTFDKTYGLE